MFTPTETKLLNVLSDGQAHTREELRVCLTDELVGPKALSVHIYRIRKMLNTRGETIVCEFRYRKYYYRHVRLLASAVDGVK